MKVNNNFFVAKNDKQVRSLCVAKYKKESTIKQVMYLCINAKIPYTDIIENVFIETDIDVKIENYSGYRISNNKVEIEYFNFHLDVNISKDMPNYMATFLSQFK